MAHIETNSSHLSIGSDTSILHEHENLIYTGENDDSSSFRLMQVQEMLCRSPSPNSCTASGSEAIYSPASVTEYRGNEQYIEINKKNLAEEGFTALIRNEVDISMEANQIDLASHNIAGNGICCNDEGESACVIKRNSESLLVKGVNHKSESNLQTAIPFPLLNSLEMGPNGIEETNFSIDLSQCMHSGDAIDGSDIDLNFIKENEDENRSGLHLSSRLQLFDNNSSNSVNKETGDIDNDNDNDNDNDDEFARHIVVSISERRSRMSADRSQSSPSSKSSSPNHSIKDSMIPLTPSSCLSLKPSTLSIPLINIPSTRNNSFNYAYAETGTMDATRDILIDNIDTAQSPRRDEVVMYDSPGKCASSRRDSNDSVSGGSGSGGNRSPLSILKAWSDGSSPSSPKNLFKRKPVDTPWSLEMKLLLASKTTSEALEVLNRMKFILAPMDLKDRLKYCWAKYFSAVNALKKNDVIWDGQLPEEVSNMTNSYFSSNLFYRSPPDVVEEILKFLPPRDFAKLSCVSTEFNVITKSNGIWMDFFNRRFSNDQKELKWLSKYEGDSIPVDFYVNAYFNRLVHPQIHDKVEVAWSGKFRLAESVDIYHGNAWWQAEIVDKFEGTNQYKVHYPGWDKRWDEWIPRHRLRWVSQAVSTDIDLINVGDKVELWCCGAHVPGTWLESKVVSLRNKRYCVTSLVSSGTTSFWVDRDRIRPMRVSFSHISNAATTPTNSAANNNNSNINNSSNNSSNNNNNSSNSNGHSNSNSNSNVDINSLTALPKRPSFNNSIKKNKNISNNNNNNNKNNNTDNNTSNIDSDTSSGGNKNSKCAIM